MSTRQELAKCFTRLAAHHLMKAKRAEADGDEEMAGEHAETGAACSECAKALSASMKADGADELEQPLISKVAPSAPSVRAVLRTGMRELPTPDKDSIAAELFGTQE